MRNTNGLTPDHIQAIKEARKALGTIIEPPLGLSPVLKLYARVSDIIGELEELLGY